MQVGGAGATGVRVIVGEDQPELERFAAGELCRYMKECFGLAVEADGEIGDPGESLFLIGSARTSRAVAAAVADRGFPELSEQGIVLRTVEYRGHKALIVGGGSPRATMWAVYELVERWGVRFLLHGDVLPEPTEFEFPAIDEVMEPNLTIRQWRTVNDFACGPESWGMEHHAPVIDQLAKLKFNRIYAILWPFHPYVHYEVRGVTRSSATLWFGDRYPISDDTIGRDVFGDVDEFWNPDLPINAGYEELAAAGRTHIHNLLGYAKSRGMECVVHVATTEFPSEFGPLLPDFRKTSQLGDVTIVPGESVGLGDPALSDLGSAVIKATVDTYPEADYLSMMMQEHRQWVEEYERAWHALDEKYGVEEICSLESILELAAARPMPLGSYSGAEARAVQEVKGDIVNLYFLDRLLDDLKVLDDTANPKIKVIWESVAEELFPILGAISKPGWQAHVSLDYFPSTTAIRDAIRNAPKLEIPAASIFTLHDDNVGILPQSTLGSLHDMTQQVRSTGWDGFSTRYWLIGDHEPTVAYLARAGWDESATPDDVSRDILRAACGDACVDDMFELFQEVQNATLILEQNAFTLAFPAPNMIMKSWIPERFPSELEEVREGYVRALDLARSAARKSESNGFSYPKYWTGRLEFGIEYLNAIESLRNAALAEDAGRPEDALRHTQTASEQMRVGIEAYAEIVWDQSDRGAIAVLNEHVYKPLQAKIAELAPSSS